MELRSQGGMRVDFPDAAQAPTYFAPIVPDNRPQTDGHVWVCAPPFGIVDVTATLQPYARGELRDVVGPVLEESPARGTYDLEDLFDRELLTSPAARGVPRSLREFRLHQPQIFERIARYGVHEVRAGQWRLTYVACGVTLSDPIALEEMGNLTLSGKKPDALMRELRQRLASSL